MNFTKEIAEKSDIDLDDEDLYAVGNMIKEIQLEKVIEEKDKEIEEKDKEIERLKARLKTKEN